MRVISRTRLPQLLRQRGHSSAVWFLRKRIYPARSPGNFGYICLFQNAVLGWFSESKEYKISLYSKVQMNSVSTYFKSSFTGKIESWNRNSVPCQGQFRSLLTRNRSAWLAQQRPRNRQAAFILATSWAFTRHCQVRDLQQIMVPTHPPEKGSKGKQAGRWSRQLLGRIWEHRILVVKIPANSHTR